MAKKTTAQIRKKTAFEPKKKSTGAKTGPRKKAPHIPEETAKRDDTQFGNIMAKGLDLAEAGLTLGLNLFQKLGASVQDNLGEKIAQAAAAGKSFVNDAVKNASASAGTRATETAVNETAGSGPETEATAGFSGVFNRLPLFPGSPVTVSFSVNNESAESVKKVMVKLEGMIGELTGTILDASKFLIKPSKQTIDPMDFEKFLITGTIPSNAKSDAYYGWIIVSGEEQLKIPARLTVTGNS
jgi:hypothetical protein